MLQAFEGAGLTWGCHCCRSAESGSPAFHWPWAETLVPRAELGVTLCQGPRLKAGLSCARPSPHPTEGFGPRVCQLPASLPSLLILKHISRVEFVPCRGSKCFVLSLGKFFLPPSKMYLATTVKAKGHHSRPVLPSCPLSLPGSLQKPAKGQPVSKHHYLWALIASADPKLT